MVLFLSNLVCLLNNFWELKVSFIVFLFDKVWWFWRGAMVVDLSVFKLMINLEVGS